MKRSILVKAAWIGGICVIVAAIIAGSFGLFKCCNGNCIDNSVTSHGQSGGSTIDMKRSVTVKAAWIGGICVIVAAIIAGSFGLLKRRNGSRIDNSVTSHGQSGGITAQNVTTPAITINNYFDGQSPDEKRALEQTLKAKYPLGYTLFAVDGKTIYVPEGLSFERDFVISWTDSKISKLEPDWIEFHPPQIIYKPTANAVLGKFNFRIPRKIGFIMSYPWIPKQANAFLEVLDDKGSFAMLVLGFKE